MFRLTSWSNNQICLQHKPIIQLHDAIQYKMDIRNYAWLIACFKFSVIDD